MSGRECLSVCGCRSGAPLVATFHFRGAELYCLECGAAYGMFGAPGASATEKLMARYEAAQAEWDEHAKDLITPTALHRDCPKCFGPARTNDREHGDHATDEERAAHERAPAWIAERRTVVRR